MGSERLRAKRDASFALPRSGETTTVFVGLRERKCRATTWSAFM
jgi:hypothetical protein